MWIVGLKCTEQTLKCHRIMCIIYHKCEVVRYMHKLNPALDPDLLQSLANLCFRYTEVIAESNCCESIVYREFAGS